MRRNALIASIALVLIGTTAVVGVTTSARPAAHPRNFTVVAPATEEKRVDVAPNGQSIGDMFIFSGPINTRAGREMGRIDGVCVTTSSPGPQDELRQQCTNTLTFAGQDGAELYIQGVGRIQAEDVIMGVTGGNRAYENASGNATFDFRQEDQVVITVRLD